MLFLSARLSEEQGGPHWAGEHVFVKGSRLMKDAHRPPGDTSPGDDFPASRLLLAHTRTHIHIRMAPTDQGWGPARP